MKNYLLLSTALLFLLSGSLIAQHEPFQLAIDVQKADSVLKAHIRADHSVVIIDLRTPGEFAGGFIEGAVNHNYYGAGFDDTLASLDKTKEYLIYCASGGRSAGAFNKMRALEFNMVYNMLGGVSAWRAAGFPLVTNTGINLLDNVPFMVKLYPNPVTSESKFIFSDGAGQTAKVKVVNMSGQIVKQFDIRPGEHQLLKSDNLVNGVYFFQVYLNGEIIQTEKFLKSR